MNIANALNVPGWMTKTELLWLAARAAECKLPILELGCWVGRSTRALGDSKAPDVPLIAVDIWEKDGHYEKTELTGCTENPPTSGWLMRAFTNNMAGVPGLVTLQMTTKKAAPLLKSRQFGMIFIDADHSYEAVREEILTYKPLLTPGGLLCGHDASRPGVIRALAELIPNVRYVPNHKDNGSSSIWYESEIKLR
jgi:SAM-dependent methyltransferase